MVKPSKEAELGICHSCEAELGFGKARIYVEPGEYEKKQEFKERHKNCGRN